VRMNTDPRVDQYIARAPHFARPVLNEARERIRKACPAAEETIKWNVPFYVLGGKLLASIAAFKKHAKVGIWIDEKPDFVDVASVEELPSAKDFSDRLKAATARVSGETSPPVQVRPIAETMIPDPPSGPAAPRKRPPAQKTSAKKTPVKKTPARKTPAKKTPARKAAKRR
jgi:hypothetical protein